ncbi:Undecaprenyl phosphate-alpha-4-amino-4-deoxy-L-arabinose arabinosyl transferase [Xanthomonas hydrangeae]|nr:Undecaprenyl phosphate-alpha-4-amino-4-deoxy-L-arabinose arabinosyl transferase [Xanthomonas hydrangeae]CAD7716583.1 Undecaprenyl phosphate-alpha-4-amino-4-deoxy-L-arabinose arabinosyl transferase [Xanthomonas hydrangeae]CAD7732088.1 Undecaprenyl phosphate-alpha-4-amino-4-deoxy-L-arabinose arabinosyl transferase [Xanthomonas hydrangeae]CAD7732091.1 Undecaprenyl phosphate-alpha-4-amino-4-deoxy-L-arabinose arabinosyl transferase [Xanthomonas hydrangeae]CAD7735016.1 Undecaprenyl phosphate-alpha
MKWPSLRERLCAVLAVTFLVRLMTLGLYPLTDTTEARYGEMARKMLETGQWIVPQIDYGVPFWGKPPLSFWLTAIAYKLMGVTEFAARLPSLLLGVLICSLTHVVAARRHGMDHGLRASVVVATCLLMMVSAGGVMTDPAMASGTTLAMVACWLALTGSSRRWGYLFFAGIAIGLLAKGPVASVLTLAPITLWAALTGRLGQLWDRLPWGWGLLLTMALVLPWYWAAERQTPGFLHYFLIGEHWYRFTVSGWKGDLYGAAHAYPRGTIWLYALAGTLPWSAWLLWQLLRRKATLTIMPLRASDGWRLYLLCWMLTPAVFFTMAGNILPTYVLPGVIGFGLLTADVWRQQLSHPRALASDAIGLVAPVLGLLTILVIWPHAGFKSQRELLTAFRQDLRHDVDLIYFPQRPYSAEFYSAGEAIEVRDVEALQRYLDRKPLCYVVMRKQEFAQLPAPLRARLWVVHTPGKRDYLLLRKTAASTRAGDPTSS